MPQDPEKYRPLIRVTDSLRPRTQPRQMVLRTELTIPEYAQLEAYARQHNVTVDNLVRAALRAYTQIVLQESKTEAPVPTVEDGLRPSAQTTSSPTSRLSLAPL
jgi:hypothetical protein